MYADIKFTEGVRAGSTTKLLYLELNSILVHTYIVHTFTKIFIFLRKRFQNLFTFTAYVSQILHKIT